MKNPLISVCIPTYNRKDIFEVSLYYACKACEEYYLETEIVVTENPSNTSVSEIVEALSKKFDKLNIKYFKNEINIGLAENYFAAVNNSSGDYCWIIGDDDFVKKDSIETLIKVLKKRFFDLIVFPFDHVNISNKEFNSTDFIKNIDKNQKSSFEENGSFESFNLSDLIDPRFKNVYLGSMMGNVFNRLKWQEFEYPYDDLDDFKSVFSIYPHCVIFAEKFMKSDIFYLNRKLITVGDGVREWGTDGKNKYWESSLPLIYFKVIPEMLDYYKNSGLNNKKFKLCLNNEMNSIGRHYFGILYRRIFKIKFNNSELLSLRRYKLNQLLNFNFILGFLIGAVKTFMSKF